MGEEDVSLLHRSPSCITDLLQNCDLPPPSKIFFPFEELGERRRTTSLPNKVPHSACLSQCGKLGTNQCLLRALQLSQTRAREAERRAREQSYRNKQMAALLLEESLRLDAARQWIRLLELEISSLRKEKRMGPVEEKAADAVATLCLALALCIGISGAGFVLSRCMF